MNEPSPYPLGVDRPNPWALENRRKSEAAMGLRVFTLDLPAVLVGDDEVFVAKGFVNWLDPSDGDAAFEPYGMKSLNRVPGGTAYKEGRWIILGDGRRIEFKDGTWTSSTDPILLTFKFKQVLTGA